MCFVWIWEQTAIISLYSINWLVCITERECVYCAVRTGSLYTASLTFRNSTFCPHSVFMCFVWIWEKTAIISLYSINWLVCITETECVYCAVRTGSLNVIIQLKFSVTVHVWFMVDEVPVGQVFLPVLQFPLSVSFHQCFTLIFIYMLLFPEGQTSETWERSKKQCSDGNWRVGGKSTFALFHFSNCLVLKSCSTYTSLSINNRSMENE